MSRSRDFNFTAPGSTGSLNVTCRPTVTAPSYREYKYIVPTPPAFSTSVECTSGTSGGTNFSCSHTGSYRFSLDTSSISSGIRESAMRSSGSSTMMSTDWAGTKSSSMSTSSLDFKLKESQPKKKLEPKYVTPPPSKLPYQIAKDLALKKCYDSVKAVIAGELSKGIYAPSIFLGGHKAVYDDGTNIAMAAFRGALGDRARGSGSEALKYVKELIFSDMDLTSFDYFLLHKMNLNLDFIRLENNFIEDKELSNFLGSITSTRNQTLPESVLGSSFGIRKSGDPVSQKVKALVLSNNLIGDEGAKTISDFIKDGRVAKLGLNSIKLDGNNLTKKGFWDIMQAIKEADISSLIVTFQKQASSAGKSVLKVTLKTYLDYAGEKGHVNFTVATNKDTLKYWKDGFKVGLNLSFGIAKCVTPLGYVTDGFTAPEVASDILAATTSVKLPARLFYVFCIAETIHDTMLTPEAVSLAVKASDLLLGDSD